jgi:hypothetical protein
MAKTLEVRSPESSLMTFMKWFLTHVQSLTRSPTIAAPGTSFSRWTTIQARPGWLDLYPGLSQAHHSNKPCKVKPLHIEVEVEDDPCGLAPDFQHHLLTASASTSTPFIAITAAIMLSSAGGGIPGPSSIYLSLADKFDSLQHHPVLVLRLYSHALTKNAAGG